MVQAAVAVMLAVVLAALTAEAAWRGGLQDGGEKLPALPAA